MIEKSFEERMRLAQEKLNRKSDENNSTPLLEGTDIFEEKMKLNQYEDSFHLIAAPAM